MRSWFFFGQLLKRNFSLDILAGRAYVCVIYRSINCHLGLEVVPDDRRASMVRAAVSSYHSNGSFASSQCCHMPLSELQMTGQAECI
jgi:hypothetical protein